MLYVQSRECEGKRTSHAACNPDSEGLWHGTPPWCAGPPWRTQVDPPPDLRRLIACWCFVCGKPKLSHGPAFREWVCRIRCANSTLGTWGRLEICERIKRPHPLCPHLAEREMQVQASSKEPPRSSPTDGRAPPPNRSRSSRSRCIAWACIARTKVVSSRMLPRPMSTIR